MLEEVFLRKLSKIENFLVNRSKNRLKFTPANSQSQVFPIIEFRVMKTSIFSFNLLSLVLLPVTPSASSLLAGMDATKDPCEDFFQYACGTWNKKHVIPEDRSSISTFEVS